MSRPSPESRLEYQLLKRTTAEKEGYIYFLRFGPDVVKIGFTINMEDRLLAHRRTARKRRVTVDPIWVTPGVWRQEAAIRFLFRDLCVPRSHWGGRKGGLLVDYLLAEPQLLEFIESARQCGLAEKLEEAFPHFQAIVERAEQRKCLR